MLECISTIIPWLLERKIRFEVYSIYVWFSQFQLIIDMFGETNAVSIVTCRSVCQTQFPTMATL